MFKHYLLLLLLFVNLAHAEVRVERNVVWDELNHLRADIYKAEANQATPVVLLIHGGGWRAGSKADMAWFGRELATHGITAVSIDYRLVSAKVKPLDQYRDVKQALQMVINNAASLNIDPNRIGVLGASAGGHLSAMLATEPDTPIKTAVLLWPATNLTDTHGLSAVGGQMLAAYIGQNGAEIAKEMSPILRLNSTMCKNWLIVHGDADELVPVQQSREFYERLKASGVAAQYLELAGQRHTPQDQVMVDKALAEIADLFAKL